LTAVNQASLADETTSLISIPTSSKAVATFSTSEARGPRQFRRARSGRSPTMNWFTLNMSSRIGARKPSTLIELATLGFGQGRACGPRKRASAVIEANILPGRGAAADHCATCALAPSARRQPQQPFAFAVALCLQHSLKARESPSLANILEVSFNPRLCGRVNIGDPSELRTS
jgi:hypothetical protein